MIRIRARNARGRIRTDFGARWQTARLERITLFWFKEAIRRAFMTGMPKSAADFVGPSLGELFEARDMPTEPGPVLLVP